MCGLAVLLLLQKQDFHTFEDMLVDLTPWSPLYRKVRPPNVCHPKVAGLRRQVVQVPAPYMNWDARPLRSSHGSVCCRQPLRQVSAAGRGTDVSTSRSWTHSGPWSVLCKALTASPSLSLTHSLCPAAVVDALWAGVGGAWRRRHPQAAREAVPGGP